MNVSIVVSPASISKVKSTPRNALRASDKLTYVLTELGELKSRQAPQ